MLQKPYSVSFEDRPVPTIADPHDVIVNVKFTGICGSDVHYWTHGSIGNFVVKDPMVLGHESSGIVTKSVFITLDIGFGSTNSFVSSRPKSQECRGR